MSDTDHSPADDPLSISEPWLNYGERFQRNGTPEAAISTLSAAQSTPAVIELKDVDAALRKWLGNMPSPDRLRQDIRELSLQIREALEAP